MTSKMQEAREAWYAESGLPTKYEASDFAAGWNAAIEAAAGGFTRRVIAHRKAAEEAEEESDHPGPYPHNMREKAKVYDQHAVEILALKDPP